MTQAPSTPNGWAAADRIASDRRRLASKSSSALPDVLTIEQAAELLQICVRTLRTIVRKNELPYRRVGRNLRFGRAALLQWLAGDSVAVIAAADQVSGEPPTVSLAGLTTSTPKE